MRKKGPKRPRRNLSVDQQIANALARDNQELEASTAAQPAVTPAPPPTPDSAVSNMTTAESEFKIAVGNIARWQRDPVSFVREVFRAEPDFWQLEALEAMVQGNFLVCMKACKGPGKSCLLAWAIWWFLLCFESAKILVTSITAENLRDNLWAELAMWRGKSKLLQTVFELQGEKIYAREAPEVWFAAARTWPKDADKSKQATTLAGHHAKNTMIVIDEAGGVPVGVLVAGLAHHATQGAGNEVHYTLMAGNPDSLDSALGWACTEDSKNWWVKEITGDPVDPKRAKRIDKVWAQEQIDKFGRDNPWIMVNIFGKFPPVSFDRILGPDQVRAAMTISFPEQTWAQAPRIMGVDVARSLGRDRSVLARRQGNTVFPFFAYRFDDLEVLAGQIAFEFARWPAKMIVVDMMGVGGGVLDHLKGIGLPAVGFNGGLPARDAKFQDRRTETYWDCRQMIIGQNKVPMISLPNMSELVAELTCLKLEWNRKGQIRVESKESAKKRGISSPDLADALTMTFAEPAQSQQEYYTSESTLRSLRNSESEYDPFRDMDKEMST